MKLSKKLIGKYVIVDWVDVVSEMRVKLHSIELAKCRINGKVIEVFPCLVLEHDSCGELGDYTMLPSSLITSLEVLCQQS